ncbi:hypothetical protein M569_02399 [Genlisea aurea]|uniref:Nucleotide-diphospho-sugar transferase domain-containing protein n=1 Tax=Genlisea aurea TaxID=192259 RepID=S8E940_9LAMI|nr:hypothetical protein M569_02399 [Genlisea aurea]
MAINLEQDADIVWFRNPFHHFHPDADFQLSSDHYAGDPFSTDNHANTGMLYIKSTPLTIDFLNLWQRARQFYPGLHSQEVFNKVKNCPVMRERGLRIKYISTEYFGGICEPSRNMSSVCTMHANCCVGLENKSCYLKSVLEDWKNYLALPPAVRESNPPSWSLSGC